MTKMCDFDLYIDADGVICDFDSHVFSIFGKYVNDFPKKGDFWQALTHHDKTVAKFFRNLPKMGDCDDLIEFCVSNFKSVKILTASGNTPHDAPQQKVEWFAEHYPDLEVIVVTKSPDKAQYATPTSILIDDRSKSIDPWVEAGGIGVLHTSAANSIEQLKEIISG